MDFFSENNVLISAVIPVFNEKKYIKRCIKSIINQDFIKKIKSKNLKTNWNFEAIFVDGNSIDNTVDIIKEYRKNYDFIKILSNPEKLIQKSLNIGIKFARSKFIVRLDAHTIYDKSYITNCLKVYNNSDAKNVGGAMIAVGNTLLQKSIAVAYCSKFALGGGKNHAESYEGYLDTVYLGFFEKSYLINIGLYDETLGGSEDDELNFRISLNGDRIYCSSEIKSYYYPRESFFELFKQFFNYGFYKFLLFKKYKKITRISQLIPAGFVVFIFLYLFSIFFLNNYLFIFNFIFIFYVILNLYFSISNKKIHNFLGVILLFMSHFIIHFSYGLGFLCSFVLSFFEKNSKKNEKKITSVELRALQLKSLEIFNIFKELCYKNDLKLFVCGGCCIGAVRHKGFIPWDDDIDAFMLREDYNKITKICESNFEFNKRFVCISPQNKKKYKTNSFIKIVDKTTTIVKKEDTKRTACGVAIDIFPIDVCPNSRLKQKIQNVLALFYCLLSSETVPKKYGIFVKIVGYIIIKSSLFLKFNQKLMFFCEKKMSKYKLEKCDYVTELCAGPRYFKRYPKEIFSEIKMEKFENIKIPLPIGYEKYLKIAFGDFLKLPPKNNRVTEHDIVFIDLAKGFNDRIF